MFKSMEGIKSGKGKFWPRRIMRGYKWEETQRICK